MAAYLTDKGLTAELRFTTIATLARKTHSQLRLTHPANQTSRRVPLPARRQRFAQLGSQRPLHGALLIARQLHASGRQVENVMRHLALGVDERNLDAAILSRQR